MPIMTVNVTQGDIDGGTPRRCLADPIGNALWRITEQKWEVFPEWAMALEPPPRRRIAFPKEITRRINLYDEMHVMSPFSFQLDIPEAKSGNTTNGQLLTESQ